MPEFHSEGDPFAGLDHELPPSSPPTNETTAATPSPTKRPHSRRRPRRKSATTTTTPPRPTWPKWFADRRRQEIAEFLAVNFWIDEMLGVEFDVTRWPYSEFKSKGVETFRAMVSVEVSPIGG